MLTPSYLWPLDEFRKPMFYLPTASFVWKPVCRQCACTISTFLIWLTCQSSNLDYVLASIWPQLNKFQRKTSTSFHKSVKHSKSFRFWEVEQVPHDLWESSFKIFLRQTLGIWASGLPLENPSKLSHKSLGPCSTSQHLLLLQCLCQSLPSVIPCFPKPCGGQDVPYVVRGDDVSSSACFTSSTTTQGTQASLGQPSHTFSRSM